EFADWARREQPDRRPGLGDVVVFGIGEYSMRIWLDPLQLQQRGLVPQDVINAIQNQNTNVAAGQIGMPPAPAGQGFQLTANVPAELSDTVEFEQIIVKAAGTQITRIRDVGHVEIGARGYSTLIKIEG